MKIYLDYIFLENLIVNAVIIIETVLYTNNNVGLKKKILIIILNTFLSVLVNLISFLDNYFFQFLIANIICLLLLGFKSIYLHIKNIITYYFVYIIYIGTMIISVLITDINLDNILNKLLLYFIVGGIAHILNKHLWKMWKTNITNDELLYNIRIENEFIPVFLDTGNMAKDVISNLNVIFLSDSLKDKLLEKNCFNNDNIIRFNVFTVNGIDEKIGYIVCNIKLYKGKEEIATIPKVIICFSNITNTPEKYSGIIGYELYLNCINGGV